MQNKPNFPHFSPKNDDFTKKQTQFKPKQTQFWANIKGIKAKTNPNKPKCNRLSTIEFSTNTVKLSYDNENYYMKEK